MKPKLTTNEAMVVACDYGYPVTRVTIINWAKKRGVGRKVGGRWYIDKDKLQKVLKGVDDGGY